MKYNLPAAGCSPSVSTAASYDSPHRRESAPNPMMHSRNKTEASAPVLFVFWKAQKNGALHKNATRQCRLILWCGSIRTCFVQNTLDDPAFGVPLSRTGREGYDLILNSCFDPCIIGGIIGGKSDKCCFFLI